mgnify:CR=1 FL=1
MKYTELQAGWVTCPLQNAVARPDDLVGRQRNEPIIFMFVDERR